MNRLSLGGFPIHSFSGEVPRRHQNGEDEKEWEKCFRGSQRADFDREAEEEEEERPQEERYLILERRDVIEQNGRLLKAHSEPGRKSCVILDH